jgi:rhodanese-related sulfurtransferase
MFKKKIKKTLRKVAVKMFDMEFDVEIRPPRPSFSVELNSTKIPKIVDGSGDTPGPNHKSNIGRTSLAAQVMSGTHPLCIDIRPPNEVVAGILPQACLLPKWTIKEKLDQLPDKLDRIIIYDQTGEHLSGQVATYLREQGWEEARSLAGGLAEWIEYGEPMEILKNNGAFQIGDAVYFDKEKTTSGYIFKISQDNAELWCPKNGYLGQHSITSLSS